MTAIFAFAASAYGPYSQVVTPNGYTFKARNLVITFLQGSTKVASGTLQVDVSPAVPSGFIGVLARIKNDSGVITKEFGWSYNPSGNCIGVSYGGNETNASGARYAHSLQRSWMGTDYWTHDTFRTPSCSVYN